MSDSPQTVVPTQDIGPRGAAAVSSSEPAAQAVMIPSVDASLEHAIDLVQKQDDLISHWTTLFVQVQTALGAAAALVFYWATPDRAGPARLATIIIAAAGIGTAWLLMKLTLRHHEWQRFYVERVKAIQDPALPLFLATPARVAEGRSESTDAPPAEKGSTRHIFKKLQIGTAIGWVVVAIAALILLPK